MFHQMRQLLQRDPGMLNAVLQQLGQSNPELLQLISQNQEAFIRMINEPDSGAAPASGPGSGMHGGVSEDMPGMIQVSQQDKEAIERVNNFSFLESTTGRNWRGSSSRPRFFLVKRKDPPQNGH